MQHLFPFPSPCARPLKLLLLGGLLSAAPTVLAQGFNVAGNSTPTGWTLNDDPDGGDAIGQTDHFRLEAALDVSLENIVTASYNLSGYSGVTFSVDLSRFGTGAPNNPLTVEVSTNGGATFTQTYTATAPTSSTTYVPRTISITTVSAATVLRLTNQGTSGRGIRLRNLVLTGTAPVVASITTGTVSNSPFCVGAAGAAVNVPYTTSGSFASGNVFTAQLSGATGSFASPTTIGTRTATTAGTISATLPTGLTTGTGYRIRVVSTNPALTGTDNGANLTAVNAATVGVTDLATGPANGAITLQWTNPASCFDDVLVVARANAAISASPNGTTTYTASSVFGSGSTLQPNAYVVYQGAGTSVTVTNLINGTNYRFAVFSRRGTVYGPAVTTNDSPTAGPALTEVFVPRYLAARPATGTLHLNRLPYAFRVTLTGLLPGTTYRYSNRAVSFTDAANSDGVGNAIIAQAGGFTRAIPASPLAGGFGTLTTSAAGTYTGWFILEPTANARFIAGELVRMQILLNNGTTGAAAATVATRLTTVSTVTALQLGTGTADATGIVDSSLATPRNFVLLYDNEAGTGRPLAATFVESDGSANTTANGYTGFYASRVEAKAGKWGALMPNSNANGVRRIEQRALVGGALVGCAATDADGVWSSLASTVNPTGGASPVALSAVDAPLQCGVYVGMNPTTQSQAEGNGTASTAPIRITVNTAPATPLTVQVTNAGGGTAAVGTDYLFNPQTITFPTTGTYPMTLTVNAQFVGDVVVEANESFNLSVTVVSGAATVVQSPGRMVIADDDFLATGLIINEVSKGPSGQKEYVELLVTGTPGATVDLRGWTLDDNNGDFSGGPSTNAGINAGHFRFGNHCTWEKVRVGSLIVLYNENDPNTTLPPGNDATDGDLDFLYVVPVRNTGVCGAAFVGATDYLEGNCNEPSEATATYTAAGTGPRWSQISITNNADAIQLRQPSSLAPTLYHGLSFANTGTTPVTAANHPDYVARGTDALYVQGGYQTYFFANTTGNDFRSRANWDAQAGSGQETPGTPNGIRNGQFIESLRQPLVTASASATDICDVRSQETRVFLDASKRLMLRVANQSTTNYGSVTAETVVGANSRNTNLEGQPFFLGKQYRVTPTTDAPANYVVTFFVTDAELDAYASYVSAQTGQPRDAAFVRPRLQIYKNEGGVLVASALTGANMNIASPVIGSYGSGVTTYSATFTTFSTFAIGASAAIVLPVELTRLSASAAPNHAVRVEWATASEKNADYFEVQRSANGHEFTAIGRVAAHGTSVVPNQYGLLDGKPLAGIAYYRLRQVDFDGKAHTSAIVTVRLGAPAVATLEAWPVPMGAELHLRLSASAAGEATLRVLDLQGRAVLRHTLALVAGATETTVPTASLGAGTYVLETLLPGGEVVRTKLVK